ncbi:cell division protein Ftsk/SpoIIIE [Mycobacteroides abscessus subsp. abscessus]|uniref:Cell division protein Ftsk/SpoIIIE n=2 Tax=Mycobacteriaceae TaxID=1762 RepID=A0AB33TDU9_9MYCO|nr:MULTISPECIES: FtsK/SpoIIIE domain-containing protein [Mycobacteriaceae]MDO3017404.1 FtsK/SpoIIIE domain-containing protein [Mycobacteroides abscessus subsp. abscessus]MDO3083408.1 FtsK/SpoIIIE domain-containing protein [Mycobacteroides abscessus subsp. abscessus]ORA80977.1 cell division protein FtsK [Mycolicibacter kumamotonensis]PVB18039.1 cell division protein FtsK [Mycobacteroides abscessus]RIR96903.1 cell division protein FtsK [Mycobacteroides abscessus]
MNPDPYAPVGYDIPLLFDHFLHLLISFVLWVVVAVIIAGVSLICWRLGSPETYEEHLAGPARLLRWRLWAHISWRRLCKRCGLSGSEHVTRRDRDGRQVAATRWFHPKLVGTGVTHTGLRLTVRARMGQTVEDLERAVPAIRDAARAHSARSVVVSPGTIRIELVMREQLSTIGNPAQPTTVTTARIRLGRCENGAPWILQVAERQTLTVGCSGSGKGSVFWGIACGFGPAIAEGLVHLIGIDLKYGIEVSVGARLFTRVATTEADAVKTLAAVEQLMDKRGARTAEKTRQHRATQSTPLIVLMIDELAGLTAYMSDPAMRKEANASLSRILSKGRGLGIVVAAFVQDPRKEVIPMRGLFTQTIALRLRSRDEVAMVLGDGLADVAPAHRISPNDPGTGYVIDEDGQVTKVRSDFWTNDQIRSIAKKYGRTRTTEAGPRHE